MNQAVEKFHAKNTLEFKQAVAETIVDHLAPINAKMEFYKRNPQVVYDVINFSFTLLSFLLVKFVYTYLAQRFYIKVEITLMRLPNKP